MIYRDDDLPQGFERGLFDQFHQQFIKKNKLHTLSILCRFLDTQPEFVRYINSSSHFDLAIHGWAHSNYPLMTDQEIKADLELCLAALNKHFHLRPTKWYLPWNGWVNGYGVTLVPRVAAIAKDYGVKVDVNCANIGHFLAGKSGEPKFKTHKRKKTIYFHFWNEHERDLVTQLLEY